MSSPDAQLLAFEDTRHWAPSAARPLRRKLCPDNREIGHHAVVNKLKLGRRIGAIGNGPIGQHLDEMWIDDSGHDVVDPLGRMSRCNLARHSSGVPEIESSRRGMTGA